MILFYVFCGFVCQGDVHPGFSQPHFLVTWGPYNYPGILSGMLGKSRKSETDLQLGVIYEMTPKLLALTKV